MRISLLTVLSILAFNLSAQLGVASFYNVHDSKDDGITTDELELYSELKGGTEFALSYWFRLKQKRVEFLPTLYYTSSEFGADNHQFQEFGFQFKTNIYLFDLGGDCDCPTFGKQGPALEKGFFVQISPGYARYDLAFGNGFDDQQQSALTLGGGLGLDIGVTNLLTLTPFAGVRYGVNPFSRFFLDGVPDQPATIDSRLMTFQLGLQAVFRFDHKRY